LKSKNLAIWFVLILVLKVISMFNPEPRPVNVYELADSAAYAIAMWTLAYIGIKSAK
jgi:hypothetical protein